MQSVEENIPLIAVTLQSSATLLTIIEFCKNITTDIPILFTKDGITIEFGSKHERQSTHMTSSHCFTLKREQMREYYFNSSEPVNLGFNCAVLNSALKGRGKDSIQLLYYEGDSVLQISKLFTESGGVKSIAIVACSHIKIVTATDRSKAYVFRLISSAFCEFFKGASSQGCTYVRIQANNKRFRLEGITADNRMGCEVEYDIDYNKEEESSSSSSSSVAPPPPATPDNFDPNFLSILQQFQQTNIKVQNNDYCYTITRDLITSYSKFVNISHKDAMITFTYGPNLCLRIESPIGFYGTYVSYIMNK